jgi:hypothetical protein
MYGNGDCTSPSVVAMVPGIKEFCAELQHERFPKVRFLFDGKVRAITTQDTGPERPIYSGVSWETRDFLRQSPSSLRYSTLKRG